MKKFIVISLCAVSPIVFVKQAYAYIDPSIGSMIVQAVIVAIAAVSVSIGIFRRRLMSLFGRIFGGKDSV